MKISALLFALAVSAGAAGLAQAQPQTQGTAKHVITLPGDVKWAPGPDVLPRGAQAAVLYGDPSKPGEFAMRLKLPRGYAIPPHTHPKPEVVTVVSGDFRLGMGPTADRSKSQVIPAGGFFAVDPGMEHYAWAETDTVVQINSTGPWSIVYVDPKQDPRSQAK